MAIQPLKKIKKTSFKKIFQKTKKFRPFLKASFWFSFGIIIGFFFFISFLYIFYQNSHKDLVYEGVFVNGINFGGKTKEEVKSYFARKNQHIKQTTLLLKAPQAVATISARQLDFGYDENLIAQQAFLIGKSDNTLSNMRLIMRAYIEGIHLPAAYTYSENKLVPLLTPLKRKINTKPVDALFNFQNGKVVAFRLSSDGQAVDEKKLKELVYSQLMSAVSSDKSEKHVIKVPIMAVKPSITDRKAESFGIRELIGEGTSLFYDSIENRKFNISLAASRLNGVLVPPGEVFSFTKTLGDVSSFTGYRQAYIIENGKTILGDGGGVCQVSTTMFRAALNAGLPILERHPHAYRVSYYEQDSFPGIDAAVFSPTVDMKFKNDTGHHILIQSYVDLEELRLTFQLYGTKDNRETTISEPVILSQRSAPEPLYQDDPAIPKGTVKQVDFAVGGANVYFTRTVKKDGKVIISDKFVSNYRPWQAVFLRGTKE